LSDHRPSVTPEPDNPKPKLGMKEMRQLRRAEAEARKAAAAARRQAEARHVTLEKTIIELESRQRELAAMLEKAPNDSASFALHRELAELTESLEKTNDEWASAAELLTDKS
jgi:hypothetical protein